MTTGWIFIHGIGVEENKGYSKIYESVLNQLSPFYESETVLWSPIVQEFEDRLYNKCASRIHWRFLRKFMTSYAADALVYYSGSDNYVKIHNLLINAFLQLRKKNVDKVNIVAHSLGTIVVNNFLWDLSNSQSKGNANIIISPGLQDFIKNSLNLIAGVGSPITLWSGQHDEGGKCLDYNYFPNLKKYLNIYSPNDVIGWPMKCINNTYQNQPKLIDKEFKYGKFLTKHTPMSHTQVWQDKKLIRFIYKSNYD